jgi:group I intron endonuclease
LKKCGIYKITNTKNGKVYIGQSCNISSRFSAHRRAEKNVYLKRAFDKYGIDMFCFEIIEELPDIQKILDEREDFYIKQYRATSYKYGYNNKAGGFVGRHTEETKRKIGEMSRNRPPASLETRAKLSKANKGHPFYGRRKMTEETKEKMRISQRERRENNKISEEFREKMRRIRMAR